MTTVNLNDLELVEFIGQDRPKQHCKATFPMLGVHGTKDIATVYFEIDPGDNLGQHTDSAEELLLILEGEAEIIIGDQRGQAGAHSLALVPKMVPHDLINTGSEKLKVLGFFGGANHIIATFKHIWKDAPSNVVNTEELMQQA